MADALKVCGYSCTGTVGGAIIGGITGFALCAWVSMKYIESTLDDNRISASNAKVITAGVDLGSSAWAFVTAGTAAGAFVGAIAAPIGARLVKSTVSLTSKAKDTWNNTHCPGLNFFRRKNNNQPSAANVRQPEVPRSPSARV